MFSGFGPLFTGFFVAALLRMTAIFQVSTPNPPCHPERQRRIPYSVASMFCSRDSSSLRFALLAAKPFPGLFHDGPKSGAAAEIAVRLSLPLAAATRNSQNDRWTEKIAPTPLFWDVCRGDPCGRPPLAKQNPGERRASAQIFSSLLLAAEHKNSLSVEISLS